MNLEVRQARQQLDLGNLAQAQSICDAALRAAPNDEALLLLVADIALRGGNCRRAIECLLEGIARNPGHGAVHYKLGCLYEDCLDYAAAVDAYSQAIRLNPALPKAHNNLGALLHLAGRMDEALRCFESARALDGALWIATYNIGQWLKAQGRIIDAILPYQEAMHCRRGFATGSLDDSAIESVTTHAKLRHDIEQLNYLMDRGILGETGRRAVAALEQALVALGPDVHPAVGIELPRHIRTLVAPWYNRLLNFHDAPALPGGAVNPDLDWPGIEAAYFANGPGMTFVDDFLKPEALASMRRFCLESTIWFDAGYGGGYVGCTVEHGFACPLLAQIAEEFRHALPGVFHGSKVTGLWGYKYDSERSGISPHADFAAVNVNFWLTPDDANLAPGTGGLVVWDKEAPLDWDFQDYNNNPTRIAAFLRESDARPYVVPHRQNRVVLFNSDLFHKTDSYRFKPGYENRRINVTMLYGDRQQAPAG